MDVQTIEELNRASLHHIQALLGKQMDPCTLIYTNTHHAIAAYFPGTTLILLDQNIINNPEFFENDEEYILRLLLHSNPNYTPEEFVTDSIIHEYWHKVFYETHYPKFRTAPKQQPLFLQFTPEELVSIKSAYELEQLIEKKGTPEFLEYTLRDDRLEAINEAFVHWGLEAITHKQHMWEEIAEGYDTKNNDPFSTIMKYYHAVFSDYGSKLGPKYVVQHAADIVKHHPGVKNIEYPRRFQRHSEK